MYLASLNGLVALDLGGNMGVGRGLLHRHSKDSTDFESGSWLIRCGSTSHRDEMRCQMPGDLLLRQLRRFVRPRLLICSRETPVAEDAIRELAEPTWLTHIEQVPTGQFDVVWDADVLHDLVLEERLRLIARVDQALVVGGTWISVARDHLGKNPRWGHPLSPEEVTGYFSPAYHEVRQEVLLVGSTAAERMAFSTLVFTKHAAISATQLDLDLQGSIQAVATRRRALRVSAAQ